MSRYDGLVIPRSYSEYINKTDAATLSQALQLNGVLAQSVSEGNNAAVTSNAVNGALRDYQPYLHFYLNANTEVDTGILINQPLASSNTYTRRKTFIVLLTAINGYGDTTSERLCILKIGRSRNIINLITIQESLVNQSQNYLNDIEFLPSSDDITDNNNNTLIIRNKSTVNNHYVSIDFLL